MTDNQNHTDGPGAEKIIWMLWHQGIDAAPLVVKNCYRSWVDKNPEWKVVLLEASTLNDYFDVSTVVGEGRDDIPLAALSDIIRINLLARFGGVWVDATCFCSTPLDDWLPAMMPSGFFAYTGHRKDTIMSSWFLAARKENYLVEQLTERVNRYWRENRFPTKSRLWLYSRVKKLLNANAWITRFWFSYPVRRWLRIKPYFWFHYLFALLVEEDKRAAEIWQESGRLSGEPPHILQQQGLLDPVSEVARRDIDAQLNAVYKLNWKLHKFYENYDPDNLVPGSTLDYLFSK